MAEDSKITNVDDIAESIGLSVGARFDSAFGGFEKQQLEIASTQRVLAIERTREEAVRQNQLLEALKNIKLEMPEIEEADSSSFLGSILKALGLIGAGAAGLAVGLAAGWTAYVADLIRDIGKIVTKFLDTIKPKFIDDLIAAFKMDGVVGKKFKAALDLVTPKFIDDIVAAFKMEGTIGAKFKKAIDAITPKFIDDIFKAFTGDGRIATKFKTAIDNLKPQFIDDIFKAFSAEGRIGMLFKTAVDTLKPQFIDDIVAAFKVEGTVGAKFKAALDAITPKFIDDIVAAFGKDGKVGQILTKVKNFFVGETNVFKTIGTAVDGAMETLKGFTGAIFDKIASPFRWLKANTTTGSVIGDMIDGVMDLFKGASGKEGGFLTKVFDGIKSVFTSLKNIGSTLMAPFDTIKNIFGVVTTKGGGILDTIMGFLNPFKTVFQTMARIGKVIAAPLTIIMGLLDAGFETKDAVEKSEGFFASLLNGILGAIGGFIDGAVFQVADFLKDGISAVAGFLNFTEVEEYLDSFSLSEMFNNFLDSIYESVNEFFNIDTAAIANALIPEGSLLRTVLPDSLFETKEKEEIDREVAEAQAARDEAKKSRIEEQRQTLKAKREARAARREAFTDVLGILGMEEGTQGDLAITLNRMFREGGIEGINKVISPDLLKSAGVRINPDGSMRFSGLQEGGIIGMSPFATSSVGKTMGLETGGLFTLSQGEFVLDNQAAEVFMKAATLLTNSQALEQARMGNGSPVIINNVDNSQRNPVVSNQATQIKVPDNPRPSDPTMLAVQGSQMFN